MSSELESTNSERLTEYRALREEVIHALQFRVWGITSYLLFTCMFRSKSATLPEQIGHPCQVGWGTG